MSHARVTRNNIDDLGYDLERLNGTQSEPMQPRCPKYSRDQIAKTRFRYQVAAVTTEEDSGQHDFFITTCYKFPNFLHGSIRINAPAPPPNGRNDAKRAVGVTAVLNLHDSARAGAGTEMRCRF